MVTDWIYLAKKTHEGAEMMLIPEKQNIQTHKKHRIMKLTLEVLVVLFRLYF